MKDDMHSLDMLLERNLERNLRQSHCRAARASVAYDETHRWVFCACRIQGFCSG